MWPIFLEKSAIRGTPGLSNSFIHGMLQHDFLIAVRVFGDHG
jgi:hypothetical protein